jgi:hypothetical protein
MKLETVKDIAVIVTQLVVAVVVVGGERWNQAEAASAARNQRKLELSLEVLRTPKPGPLTPAEKKVREWAESEFERQVQIAWSDDIKDYVSDGRRNAYIGPSPQEDAKPDTEGTEDAIRDQLQPQERVEFR